MALADGVQRPVVQRKVRGAQLNAADGSASRMPQLLHWLVGKASAGVVFVGFCELNGWDQLQSATDLASNVPAMTARAAAAGFAHSHVMASPLQPYSLGLMSALPMQVVAEYGPQHGLQRGVLHVFLPALTLHVLVAHLHAHSASARAAEAKWLADTVLKPLLQQQGGRARVVLQGDFNTLSPADAAQHEATGLLHELGRKDYPGFDRLSRKFRRAGTGSAGLGALDYAPFETLLSTGMVDACQAGCRPPSPAAQWRTNASSADAYSACMAARCSHSVPTAFSAEWTAEPDKQHPPVRVDHVLVSPAIAQLGGDGGVWAQVERTALTAAISDHFPLEIEWEEAAEYELARRTRA